MVGRYGRRLSFRTGLWPCVAACVAGSNKYYSEVPPEREAGEHEIVISLKSGWSQLVPDLEGCELLRQRVTVQSDRTQLLFAGCIAAGAILVLALLMSLLFKNKERAKELLSSFASVEGVLTVKISLEAWCERLTAAVALLLANGRNLLSHRAIISRPHFAGISRATRSSCRKSVSIATSRGSIER